MSKIEEMIRNAYITLQEGLCSEPLLEVVFLKHRSTGKRQVAERSNGRWWVSGLPGAYSSEELLERYEVLFWLSGTPTEEFFVEQVQQKKPWLEANGYGERPGDICCQRACGRLCYEHNASNYVLVNGQWKIKE